MQLFSLLFIIWTHKPLLVFGDTCQIQTQPCSRLAAAATLLLPSHRD